MKEQQVRSYSILVAVVAIVAIATMFLNPGASTTVETSEEAIAGQAFKTITTGTGTTNVASKLVSSECTDEDGDKSYAPEIESDVTVTKSLRNRVISTQTLTDYCLSETEVVEYSCDGNEAVEEVVDIQDYLADQYGYSSAEAQESDWHCRENGGAFSVLTSI